MSGRFPGKPLYVPETMPIAEIMKNMEKRGRLKLTIKGQTEEGLAANINQKGPASTATNLRPGDEFDGSIVTLLLMAPETRGNMVAKPKRECE